MLVGIRVGLERDSHLAGRGSEGGSGSWGVLLDRGVRVGGGKPPTHPNPLEIMGEVIRLRKGS